MVVKNAKDTFPTCRCLQTEYSSLKTISFKRNVKGHTYRVTRIKRKQNFEKINIKL
jgi:hypothetical protein